jgi:hypothetical protein
MKSLDRPQEPRHDSIKKSRGIQARTEEKDLARQLRRVRFSGSAGDTPVATGQVSNCDDKSHPPDAAIFRLAGAIVPFDS